MLVVNHLVNYFQEPEPAQQQEDTCQVNCCASDCEGCCHIPNNPCTGCCDCCDCCIDCGASARGCV